MTTWTTFETIDERGYVTEFYIDRPGMHSYVRDERTRFKLERVQTHEYHWRVIDLEDDEHTAPMYMRDAIRWVAGKILYGA
jgi:hypothetical protein